MIVYRMSHFAHSSWPGMAAQDDGESTSASKTTGMDADTSTNTSTVVPAAAFRSNAPCARRDLYQCNIQEPET